jgi:ADP-heptose:LPS heptosyltransferase
MGVNYISDVLGVPTVNIMGTCDQTTQAPENNCRLVTNPELCRPFMKTPAEPYYSKLGAEIEKCYQSITPETVLAVCEEFIK